jgi:hypothetical protein
MHMDDCSVVTHFNSLFPNSIVSSPLRPHDAAQSVRDVENRQWFTFLWKSGCQDHVCIINSLLSRQTREHGGQIHVVGEFDLCLDQINP